MPASSTRRRFGRVRKLPSGRWQARYPGPDGRDRSAPSTFATKTDAARFLAAVEVDMGRGVWLDPLRSGVTLREYSQAWLAERTVRGRPLAVRTRETYQNSLDRWVLPALGGLPLDRITPAAVRRWHAETSAATGPTATRQAYALLHAILATAVADDALPRNPCRIKGAGQARSDERPLLDVDQVQHLSAHMPENLRGLVELAFWAHLRLGELLALRIGDIDMDAGTVAVQRQVVETDTGPVESPPKAGSQRVVHLPPQGVSTLAEHLKTRSPALPTARLFVRRDGRTLRAHHVHAAWSTARRAADLPDVHLHDLRHAGLNSGGAERGDPGRGHATCRPLVVPRGDDLPARGRAARRRGRSPPRAPRRGHEAEPYGHVAGTRADGDAGLPSPELSGQRKTAGESGGRGIRTHDGCNPIAVFKTAAIGH
jgi:integrase